MGGDSTAWRPPSGYVRLGFVDFVAARQHVLERRRAGEPQGAWTDDPVLQRARFCNIDRRDDYVSRELIAQLKHHSQWDLRERVLLAAALRFTSSRRGEAAIIADLIEAGRGSSTTTIVEPSPLRRALMDEEIKCGSGTYQMCLNRKQVATVLEPAVDAVVARARRDGPFDNVAEASDFVAGLMTAGGKRPQFSANEACKDFAYIDGLMSSGSHDRCHLGPGARKGLALVRSRDTALHAPGKDEEAVATLRAALRARSPSLAWVEAIDVEQALCEYAKYVSYCEGGVRGVKRFEPRTSRGADAEAVAEPTQVKPSPPATGSKRKRA